MCIACKPALLAFVQGSLNRQSFVQGVAALAGTVAAAGVAGPALAATQDADTIFHGDAIYTMNAASPKAQALAVKGGKIVAVGSLDDVMRLRGSGTHVVDIGTQTLLPGFVEPHMHSMFAFFDNSLNLGPFENASMADVKVKIQAAVAAAKPGEWIAGQLFDPLITPGTFDASIGALDALAPVNPLFILEDNGHIAFANSKAFAAAGITKDTPNPPQGVYVRDASGNLTGQLNEAPSYEKFLPLLPQVTPAQYVANIVKLYEKAASTGCTSLHDMGVGMLNPQLDYSALVAAMK
ncbi:MAG TPA: amidohydrolase family protein, partial [Candidatus Acidoferrales bacterium]|nr:amidohydrolase family protein [Candidatus Acidoferrales bacterium]